MNRFTRVKGSLSTMRRDGVDRDQFQENDGGVRSAGEVGGGWELDRQEVDEEIKRHGFQDAMQA